MRWLLCLSILASSLSAQEQKCRVEGQVLSIAGMSLKKATLRLQSTAQPSQSTTPTNYVATSDGEGKFVFEDVVPGTYTLSAQRTGYVGQSYSAKSPGSGVTQLKLDSGQVLKDLLFKLIPQGIIFGKVVDEDGEPLPSFSIQASRWVFMNGKKQLQTAGNGTDAR